MGLVYNIKFIKQKKNRWKQKHRFCLLMKQERAVMRLGSAIKMKGGQNSLRFKREQNGLMRSTFFTYYFWKATVRRRSLSSSEGTFSLKKIKLFFRINVEIYR